MLCQFDAIIFPKNPSASHDGYMVVAYHTCKPTRNAEGQIINSFRAVGYCLPTAKDITYNMEGKWERDKYGMHFAMEKYEEVVSRTREGIIAYLASGQIKGIGKKTAEKIYNVFGEETLEILDLEPEKLLTVKGISKKKLKKIRDSYLASRGARDVIVLLAPYGVSPKRAVKLYREYGAETVDIIKNHPYRLCELTGIAFRTADKLALSMGFDPLSPERLDEALIYTLTDAESKGHLCLEKRKLLKDCAMLLATRELTPRMLIDRACELVKQERLISYDDSSFRTATAKVESSLANEIVRQLKGSVPPYKDLDKVIAEEEKRLRFTLASEQREAIKMALTSKFCVITGGPGTGKTSVQRILLDLYKRRFPMNKIVCCAPTGKAARRMEQSTGMPASTIHSALCLRADEDYDDAQPLDADLVLVDEVSMVDVYLAEKLLKAIPDRARLILVGDNDQLPSVGPGAVLKEIIECGLVPVVKLDRVFRQKEGSSIAVNAKLIRHGETELEFGSDFELIESPRLNASADKIEEIYLQQVEKYGLDNVVLLSPYRKKTETGVNALNERLQAKVNPPSDGKLEVVFGQRTFRVGDKVMQTKNEEDIRNGDVGSIISISGDPSEEVIQIDFGNGRVVEYEDADLEMLDLAYACTVHKSQGDEYKSVIINLQRAHHVMLVRPLIYTAITRAKERVIIVGERKAVDMAIQKVDTEKRGTKLAMRIREIAGKQ